MHKNFSPLFNPAASEDMKVHARKMPVLRLEARFSVADAYLFTVLGWADRVDVSLTDWPQLGEDRARIAARPAVQQALRAEGLIK